MGLMKLRLDQLKKPYLFGQFEPRIYFACAHRIDASVKVFLGVFYIGTGRTNEAHCRLKIMACTY
jgi:hypothetical protein